MLSAALALAASACRGRDDNGGTTRPPPPPPGTVSCPGDGLTVCDLKLDGNAEQPAAGDPIILSNVVVTTPVITLSKSMDVVTLLGFWVQDQTSSETLNGQYSGILVAFKPELGFAPELFDIVNVTGVYDTFGREGYTAQKQVEASALEITGQKGNITPVEIERSDLIATNGEKAVQYEGVLVRVNEATITATDVMPNDMPIFGAFVVDQSLIVTDAMYTYNNPVVNEIFTSISGVLRLGTAPFDAGQYMLTPRFAADVVPKNAAMLVRTIRDIQDPSAPGHPIEGCRNDNGNETVGKCANVELTNVVVTAVGGYVSTNLRALWIQDDTVTDGKWSAVKVVYNPERIMGITPTRGMRVSLTGQVIEYRNSTQVQYPEFEQVGTDMVELQPVLVTSQDIARTTIAEASPYEAVLVKIENAVVTTSCLEDNLQRDHGNWIVDGVVYVGTSFMYDYNGGLRPMGVMCLTPEGEPTGMCSCASHSRPNDLRMNGDSFSMIAGVTDYSFNEFQIHPRDTADLNKN